VTPADLEGERLIVMKEGHCLGDQVLAFCDQGNFRARISFRSAQLETILALVGAGMGISLIPAMAADSRPTNGVSYRSFRSPRPSRKIAALWLKQRPLSRAADEFLRLAAAGAETAGG
jgi:LysR family hydrogen peroxide-inducible transcriptional activator